MEKLTQKWAIIAPLQPVQDGVEFSPSEFPLHITLAGVFATKLNGAALSEELLALLSNQSAFEARADTEDHFGPNKDIVVMKIKKTPALMALYNTIHTKLIQLGVTFNQPQYEDAGYLPHSTKQKHAEVRVDDSVVINSVAIIDLFPNRNGHKRKIVTVINFTAS